MPPLDQCASVAQFICFLSFFFSFWELQKGKTRGHQRVCWRGLSFLRVTYYITFKNHSEASLNTHAQSCTWATHTHTHTANENKLKQQGLPPSGFVYVQILLVNFVNDDTTITAIAVPFILIVRVILGGWWRMWQKDGVWKQKWEVCSRSAAKQNRRNGRLKKWFKREGKKKNETQKKCKCCILGKIASN